MRRNCDLSYKRRQDKKYSVQKYFQIHSVLDANLFSCFSIKRSYTANTKAITVSTEKNVFRINKIAEKKRKNRKIVHSICICFIPLSSFALLRKYCSPSTVEFHILNSLIIFFSFDPDWTKLDIEIFP